MPTRWQKLLIASLAFFKVASTSEESDIIPISETVGDTIGVALSGGAVLVQAVSMPYSSKSKSWCLRHVLEAQTSMGFNQLSSHSFDKTPETIVYSVPLLDEFLREDVIAEAERTALVRSSGWTTHRHDTFPTRDLPVSLLTNGTIVDGVYGAIKMTMIPAIAALFQLPVEDIPIKDVFIVKYDAEGDSEYRGLVQHTDNSAFSFNALLSNPNEFSGGGTSFEFLGNATTVLTPSKGSALLHRGALKHSGIPITSGVRYILVGFLGQKGI